MAVGTEGLEVGRGVVCEVVVDMVYIQLAGEKWNKSAALAAFLEVLAVLLLGAQTKNLTFLPCELLVG